MLPPKSVQGYINELLNKEAENRGEIERLREENKKLRKQIENLVENRK